MNKINADRDALETQLLHVLRCAGLSSALAYEVALELTKTLVGEETASDSTNLYKRSMALLETGDPKVTGAALEAEATRHATMCRSAAVRAYYEPPDRDFNVTVGDRLAHAARLLDALVRELSVVRNGGKV